MENMDDRIPLLRERMRAAAGGCQDELAKRHENAMGADHALALPAALRDCNCDVGNFDELLGLYQVIERRRTQLAWVRPDVGSTKRRVPARTCERRAPIVLRRSDQWKKRPRELAAAIADSFALLERCIAQDPPSRSHVLEMITATSRLGDHKELEVRFRSFDSNRDAYDLASCTRTAGIDLHVASDGISRLEVYVPAARRVTTRRRRPDAGN